MPEEYFGDAGRRPKGNRWAQAAWADFGIVANLGPLAYIGQNRNQFPSC